MSLPFHKDKWQSRLQAYTLACQVSSGFSPLARTLGGLKLAVVSLANQTVMGSIPGRDITTHVSLARDTTASLNLPRVRARGENPEVTWQANV